MSSGLWAGQWRQAPDFRGDEPRCELAQGPVRFRLLAQPAKQGDPTADPSKTWPEDRELDLGEIALTRPADADAERELMLLPGNAPDGIEPSAQPMIDVRDEADAVSFSRRSE